MPKKPLIPRVNMGKLGNNNQKGKIKKTLKKWIDLFL